MKKHLITVALVVVIIVTFSFALVNGTGVKQINLKNLSLGFFGLFTEEEGEDRGDSTYSSGEQNIVAGVHNEAPGTEFHTFRYPPDWKHIDFPERPQNSLRYPPRWGSHNDAPGTEYDTLLYPPEWVHNEAPGNEHHTDRYPSGWRHDNTPGRYQSLRPPPVW